MDGVLKRRLLGTQCGVQGQEIYTDYVHCICTYKQNKWDSQGLSEIKWFFSIMLECCFLMVCMLTINLLLNLWIFEACTFWNHNSLTCETNTSVIFQSRVASACDKRWLLKNLSYPKPSQLLLHRQVCIWSLMNVTNDNRVVMKTMAVGRFLVFLPH